MPTIDQYDQKVEIASLFDAPNAEELAKDIVNGILPKSVLEFQSASERNATIPSPKPGMVAYLITEDLFTGYTASGWMVLAAGSQVWRQVPLTADWGHNGNQNGNFQYRLVNLFGQRTIMLDGGIERLTAYPADDPPGGYFTLNSSALPDDARPSTRKTLTVTCSDIDSTRIALKLDIRMDGWLRLYGFTLPEVAPPWVSFNGVFCSL